MNEVMENLVRELYNREYAQAFRAHTVGMENMPIAPATYRAIAAEASEEVDRIIDGKRYRLYQLLQKRKSD